MSLKIEVIETKKSKIKHNEYMEEGVIGKHPLVALFNGSAGSGKTNLLVNLMKKKYLYGGYFDKIYLFSGSPDDMFDHIGVKDKNVFTDPKKWDGDLENIMEKSARDCKKKGIDKCDKILILFEDVINYGRFMRTSPWFQKCFIASRHYNVSTFITTQSWTKVPRVCRNNANSIFMFKGTEGEKDLLATEYSPSNMTKREFKRLIDFAVKDPYNFLTIHTRLPEDERFRKNLDEVLTMSDE